MKTFPLEILTPAKPVFKDAVESLVVPGEAGSTGILAGHTPLLATLVPGRICLEKDGQRQHYRSGAGFVEVLPDRVTLLVDSFEPADGKEQ